MIDYLNPHHIYPDTQAAPDLGMEVKRDEKEINKMADKQVAISKMETPTQADIDMAIDRMVDFQSYIETDYQENGTANEDNPDFESDMKAFDTALHALRDARDRQGCWYCEDGSGQVADRPDKPPVEANYCGVCGRPVGS